MAKLIPSLNTCLSKMTSGEKRFARRLEDLLEDDYLCWYDIPVGRRRRYPDFIILHPSRGLLFLEVKDWKVDSIKHINAKTVELLTKTGLKTVANPLEQVRHSGFQGLRKLEADALLKQPEGGHAGKLCFPYGFGVVFTDLTRLQWEKMVPEDARESVLPDHLVIFKDEMTASADPEVFQTRLWDMFTYRFGQPLTLPQIDRIRWHLFPEIRIADTQESLFPQSEEEELDDIPSVVPDIIKIMDVQQELLARSLGEGHRIIHGVAGSGKTLILGYRCLYLAEALNKPILILCFNITLASRLRGFIRERGIESKVQVKHFHDWCGEQLVTYHVDLIPGKAPTYERKVASVIKGVEQGLIPRGQYGALLIDEGHDFEAEWLSLIAQMVDPETNSLLLLYDDAQSIYKKKSALNFSLSSVGIQAQGRTTILKLNYRNTRQILDFAYRFAEDAFASTGETEIPLIKPEAAGKDGSQPCVRQHASLKGEVDFLVRCLIKWHNGGKPWRDIAVLYPTKETGKAVASALLQHGIPCHLAMNSDEKRAYDPQAEKVTVLAIPSSKGLEFDTVVVVDATFRMPTYSGQEVADDIRRLYVGFTRATDHLLVTYHRQTEIEQGLMACSLA